MVVGSFIDPGLYPLINEMVKKYVGPLLFTPLSFQLNVQQLMAGNALTQLLVFCQLLQIPPED